MKANFLFTAFMCCSTFMSVAFGQVDADKVYASGPCNPINLLSCPYGVINPQNAVDGIDETYATMRTAIGIGRSSYLALQFTQMGMQGMYCIVYFQKGETVLTADVLSKLTISVYDSNIKVIGKKSGFVLANVDALNSSGDIFTLRVNVSPAAKNIAGVKIDLGGLADVNNSLRVYKAVVNSDCPPKKATSVFKSLNTLNPNNAVSVSEDDYALLAPPLIAGTAFLDAEMPTPVKPGRILRVFAGEGNHLLDASLLSNVAVTGYDASGKVVVNKSGFALADADVLDGARFVLKVPVPAGNDAVRIRVTLNGLLNLLTTMRVYSFQSGGDDKPLGLKVVSTTGDSSLTCSVKSLTLAVNPAPAEGSTIEWYRNNIKLSGATGNTLVVKQPGKYFAVVTSDGGCSSMLTALPVTKVNCFTDDNSSADLVTVYPNPFNQYATIRLSSQVKGAANITIKDKSGTRVWQYKASANASVKVLADAPAGLYFMSVDLNGTISTFKLVKL